MDESHPYIHVDMSQCIYRDRCVRICAELQGQFVWSMHNRGEETAIVAESGVPLGQSSCVSCGACVDTCPTGALDGKQVIERKRATHGLGRSVPIAARAARCPSVPRTDNLIAVRPERLGD